MKINFPPKNRLIKTDPGDPLFFHYIPLIGYVFKKRLENTLKLLGSGFGNLLEVGFGSGILLKELSNRSKNVFGVDMHEKVPEVRNIFNEIGIKADLRHGSVLELPYEDNFFDGVVAVSIFEHLKPAELEQGFKEVKGVLKKGGKAVFSFPTRNIITDVFFQTIGWNSKEWNPRVMHPSSHSDIISAGKKHFEVKNRIIFPKHIPTNLSLYCSIECLKK